MPVTAHTVSIRTSGDRIDRRLTGSVTVLTVLTVAVFCSWPKISYGQATVETVALTVRDWP